MSIYEDNTFAPDKEYTSSPSIGIGTYVYTQVELESVEDPNLVVTMESCYATQTRDPSDLTTAKHFLIRDRYIYMIYEVRWNRSSTYVELRVT